MDRQLLGRFLEVYPFQPATAVWRASEVAGLSDVRYPMGRGLDLGCGDGRLTRLLSERLGGLKLVGLDVDPLETALAIAGGLYDRVHTSPANHIPEPDAAFDFVISVSVMEHIPQLELVLSDVARVLKPGGQLITTVPGPGFHACLRGPVLPGTTRAAYLTALDQRVAHLRYWTTDEWRDALDSAGLTLLKVRPILSRSEVRRWETISRLTAGILHAISGGKPPIQIQRSLGLRQPRQRLPAPLARALATVLAVGLNGSCPAHEGESGCLLVIATRR